MPELEDLLRDAVRRQSDAYVPSTELPERITGRVAARERRRRAVAGLAAAAACLVVAAGVAAALVLPADDDGDVRTGPADDTVATTTAPTTPPTSGPATSVPPTTTTTPTTTVPTQGTVPSTATTGDTTTTAEPTEGPAAVGPTTPLTRRGVGPIVAGMTVAEAEAESGNTITVDEPLAPGSTCRTGGIDGTDLSLMMSAPDGTPDGQVVIESVMNGASTAEGVAIGDTLADLRAAYGEPTEVREYPYIEGGQVVIFASGGFAYSATLDATDVVTELESGLPASVGNLEGCA